MTAPDTSLTEAFHHVFGTPPYTTLPTPGSYEDYSDQRPGLSRSARREQRRPWSPRPSENWADELAACEMGWRGEAS